MWRKRDPVPPVAFMRLVNQARRKTPRKSAKEKPMQRQPISQEGYDKIRAEIDELDGRKPAILERIKSAREEGDLKENAEYHASREDLAHLERRITDLRSKLASCEIMSKDKMVKGEIGFGSKVTVKDLSDGMKEQYILVGPGEDDLDADVPRILTSSPFAQAMIGKKVGDQFEAEIPAGTLKMEVVEIEDP